MDTGLKVCIENTDMIPECTAIAISTLSYLKKCIISVEIYKMINNLLYHFNKTCWQYKNYVAALFVDRIYGI